MEYLLDEYYLQETAKGGKIPFEKTVLVAAKTVGRWCVRYEAGLIASKNGVKETRREGVLPEDPAEKERFIEGLVNWIFENNEITELFKLTLYDGYKDSGQKNAAKFDHHDDTCCWIIRLNEEEFRQLQKTCLENGLPEDLFYPRNMAVCVDIKPSRYSKWLRPLDFLSYQRCYSPKQWKEEQDKLKGQN
jgi:hypothetical protein